VLIAVIAFLARSMSAKRLAAADARERGLASFGEAMALHDAVAVLPMSSDADRARLLIEASANLERVDAGFDALATDPALAEAAAEIDDVRLALDELHGALQAQVAAAAIEPELLRMPLSELQGALEAFRRRLSPPRVGT
jgi:hypothetical protein